MSAAFDITLPSSWDTKFLGLHILLAFLLFHKPSLFTHQLWIKLCWSNFKMLQSPKSLIWIAFSLPWKYSLQITSSYFMVSNLTEIGADFQISIFSLYLDLCNLFSIRHLQVIHNWYFTITSAKQFSLYPSLKSFLSSSHLWVSCDLPRSIYVL